MAPKKFGGSSDMKIAVIGDSDTVTGFLLTGMGAKNANSSNFFVVDSKTDPKDLEDTFTNYTKRSDLGMIIIVQSIADQIRPLIDAYDQVIPTVIEIPSKDVAWDPTKDSMLQRVKLFTGDV